MGVTATLYRHWPALVLALSAAAFLVDQVRRFRRRERMTPLPTISEANRSIAQALREQQDRRERNAG